MKQIVSVLLIVLLILIALPMSAIAETTTTPTSGTTGDCVWKLEGTVLTISGIGSMADYTYNIYLRPWNNLIFTEVVIDEYVTHIGDSAFNGFNSIKSVTIGGNVSTIGSYAFADCCSITDLTLGERVTTIGRNAFSNCKNLTDITIPNSVVTIGSYSFDNCIGLEEITIPDSVVYIGARAFYRCVGLSKIKIGSGVSQLGEYAFSGCIGLTNVTIPGNVISVENRSFYGCDRLADVTIADGVIKIGAEVFRDCFSLENISIGNTVATIGDFAFADCDSLVQISIPDSVTTVSAGLFAGCNRLNEIVLGDSIISIGSEAFRDCISLKNAIIPNTVKSIGAYAYTDCYSLKNIIIPNSVDVISEKAFCGCIGIKSVVIPNNAILIGDYTFTNCDNITDVWFIGDEQDKEKIKIYNGNSCLVDATWHYNSCPIGSEHKNDGGACVCTVCGGVCHTNGELIKENEVSPNCAETGSFDNVIYCQECSVEILRETIVVEALGHTIDLNGFCDVCGETVSVFEVEDVRGQVGQIVDVAVMIKGNPGIISTQLELEYDNTALELLSVESNEAFSEIATIGPIENNPIVINWTNGTDSNVYDNGTFAILKFKINDNAEEGKYDITISYSEEDVFDFELNNIPFEVKNGQIQVYICEHVEDESVIENRVLSTTTTDGSYDEVVYCSVCAKELSRQNVVVPAHLAGDVNCDGYVNNKDVVSLLRYHVGWDVAIDFFASDVNIDNKINNKDAVLILRYINGWDVDLK